jgi:hypothetical protein
MPYLAAVFIFLDLGYEESILGNGCEARFLVTILKTDILSHSLCI